MFDLESHFYVTYWFKSDVHVDFKNQAALSSGCLCLDKVKSLTSILEDKYPPITNVAANVELNWVLHQYDYASKTLYKCFYLFERTAEDGKAESEMKSSKGPQVKSGSLQQGLSLSCSFKYCKNIQVTYSLTS